MKKTTVRFTAVGTVLVLGTLAIALAQHDSRQRPRDSQPAAKPVAEAPQPILVDGIDPNFRGLGNAPDRAEPSAPLVRANDDPALAVPPSLAYDSQPEATDNPLRTSLSNATPSSATLPSAPYGDQAEPLGALEDNSSVELASGEGAGATSGLPSSLPALPPLQGTLGAQPLPVQSSPSASASPSAPAAETNALSSPPPGWVNSGAIPPKQSLSRQSLSDTQRPAMPATSLPPTSQGGAQSWLQAPPMNGNGSLAGAAGAGLPTGGSTMGAVGSSPVATPISSDTGLGAQTGATHSRLSDSSEPAPIVAQEPPSYASTQSLGSQGLSSSGIASGSPASGRPLAPSATLGSPQPQSAAPVASAGQYPEPAMNPGLGGSLPDRQPTGMSSAQPLGQLTSGSGRSLLAGTALGSLISNQPGNRHLDGSQNPIMLIQKRTAGECQVGKRATIVITVRNSGNATAHDVQVIDSVPSGASFAESIPAITPTPEGVLVWQLGEMAPGDERTINLQIVPERQGELGSVASVRFAAQASVRTLATLPKVEVAYTAARDVLIGNQHEIDVVVKNVGTGVAHNVRLEADLPTNIRHESGDAGLEASFGDIAPGESKHIRLNSIAAEPGEGVCSIRALTDDGLQHEQKVELHVLSPALQATIHGPSKRYLDRQATFEISIQNTGTAPATNCEFVLRLPAGLNFNTANKHGTYDPDQHAVLWSVPEFPAGHTEAVELTVLPVQAGTLAMTFQGTAELGAKAEARGELTVEEQAELAFTIEQDADPIELSASTTYTVEVRNVGRVDHNVQLTVQLPPGSKILKVDPAVKYAIQGDQLLFEPLPQMDSRTGHKFRFEVQHAQAGTQIVRAQLKSQNRPTPVIKEEATDVYNDRN